MRVSTGRSRKSRWRSREVRTIPGYMFRRVVYSQSRALPPSPLSLLSLRRFLCLFAVVSVSLLHFRLMAPSNQFDPFHLEFVVVVVVVKACLPSPRVLQVRMAVAVRAAEHQSGTRSTPRCSRTPGTTPASSKWTRFFASDGCALCCR